MSDSKESAAGGASANEARLTDHEYDGIQEFDNVLPRWWLGTFYATIVFAIVYFCYYLLGPGPTLTESFEAEQAKREWASQSANANRPSGPDEAQLLAIAADPERRRQGQAVFLKSCQTCHGEHGQGNIGPNLTDDYWLHGGKISDIAHTVSEGVLDKGMPPWKTMLTSDELGSVVGYVRSLRGTKPANAKAPQGELQKD